MKGIRLSIISDESLPMLEIKKHLQDFLPKAIVTSIECFTHQITAKQYKKEIENCDRCPQCDSKDIDKKFSNGGDSWEFTCSECGLLIDED